MSVLKPAPEGQPTSSVKRFLEHSIADHNDWLYEVAALKRKLRTAEDAVLRTADDVKLYRHQLELREAEGRDD